MVLTMSPKCIRTRRHALAILVILTAYDAEDAAVDFALKHLPNDPLFKLVSKLYETVPGVLQATGKVRT